MCIVNPRGNLILVSLFLLLSIASSCQKSGGNVETGFSENPSITPLSTIINESSGTADSRINPGYLWVLEDSGNPPGLILLGHDGNILKNINIRSAINHDWEEMALAKGPDPALDYLYVADIGDNGSANSSCTIYRFPEPSKTTDTVKIFDRIVFQYPDGPHDAEAFLVDDVTKDIFIISKRDKMSRIYRLPGNYSTSAINTLEFVNELSYNGVTGAAISPDGRDILVKTYTKIFYYTRTPGITIPQALKTTPIMAPYRLEPQGEAVCFASDNSGYYTLSEKSISSSVSLYFYKRK